MAKKLQLHQIIALVNGRKTRSEKLLTEAHHGWNKDAISGISKIYTSKDENGEKLPPEQKHIQVNVADKLKGLTTQLSDYLDLVITQETANTIAKANVELGDKVVLNNVPVGALLFLEKRLEDIHTFITGLPVLPPDREWLWDGNKNCFATKPVETIRTQKVPKTLVKYEATKEHPAQTEVYHQDEAIGKYETTYLSSAIPSEKKAGMLAKVEALQDAVKNARQTANSSEIEQVKMGQILLNLIFGDEIIKAN